MEELAGGEPRWAPALLGVEQTLMGPSGWEPVNPTTGRAWAPTQEPGLFFEEAKARLIFSLHVTLAPLLEL